jgi:hypothetical protein
MNRSDGVLRPGVSADSAKTRAGDFFGVLVGVFRTRSLGRFVPPEAGAVINDADNSPIARSHICLFKNFLVKVSIFISRFYHHKRSLDEYVHGHV